MKRIIRRLLMSRHVLPVELSRTLAAPEKPANLPFDIQWLAGEGAGSWFLLRTEGSSYQISRFTADGQTECSGLFTQQSGPRLQAEQTFEFTYLSHCQTVTIIQNRQKIILTRET